MHVVAQHPHSTARRPFGGSVLILIAPEEARPRIMSAHLRSEPGERAVYRAEDMGATARHGGNFEFALLVASLAGGGGDEGGIDIKGGVDEVAHEVGR